MVTHTDLGQHAVLWPLILKTLKEGTSILCLACIYLAGRRSLGPGGAVPASRMRRILPLVNLGPERLNVPNLERKLSAF